MEPTVDVLVVASGRGADDRASRLLQVAGHRVHHCHDAHQRTFPCRGVVDPEACPLARGAQVALLVRGGVRPRPTASEQQSVSCALRSGLPVVEQGTDLLDPFDAWITARVDDDDVVTACVAAVVRAEEPLRAAPRAATTD